MSTELEPADGSHLTRVTGWRDRCAVAGVTSMAYGVQLLTRPWTSQLGPLIPASWVVMFVLVGPALRTLPWPAAVVVVVCLMAALVVFVATVTAIALGLVLVIHPAPARRTAYLWRDPRGWACVVVHGVDGVVWEPKSLAAWPGGRGLGSSLGRAVLAEADRHGAAVRVWSTRYLEATYRARGFTTVRRRWGMRLLQRPPASPPQR